MLNRSERDLGLNVPSNWPQISFICFDLGVMNVVCGTVAALYYSHPLKALGFARSSFWLGLFFIILGRASYKTRRLPIIVPVIILAADALHTFFFLPKYQLAVGVLLVKISFLFPIVLTLLSMVRVRLKLRNASPESKRRITEPPNLVPALLRSTAASVGAGMTALLLFVNYGIPALTQSTNSFINVFHDLLILPLLLVLFPIGAALGELIWAQASRFQLKRSERALFIRYLEQLPFCSSLAARMIKEETTPSSKSPQAVSTAEGLVVNHSASLHQRFWRQCVLIGTLSLVPIIACFVLVLSLILPDAFSGPAYAGTAVAAPGTLVVSQSGNGQYRSISDAVAAASPGATILVRPGLYRERVVIEKDITLIGDQKNPGDVTVRCYQGGCLSIATTKAHVRNLTVAVKAGWFSRLLKREHPAAVIIVSEHSVIEDSDISSNNGPGIIVSGSYSAPEIRNVRVHDCTLNGILFTNKSQGVVEDSEIYANEWAGIRSDYGSDATVRRTRIHSGKMDGILMDLGGAATLEDCEIFGNKKSGVHVREGSAVSLSRSRIFKNGGRGIMIHDQAFARTNECDVSENKNGGIEVTDESDAQVVNTKVHHEEICAITVGNNSKATIEGAIVYENATGLRVQEGAKPIVRKSVFRSHVYSAIEVETGGDPLIEQSQLFGGQNSGIYFFEGGAGRVHDCTIFGYMKSNIVIRSGSNAQITKTRLSESRYAGVLVLEGGQGSVTDCEIFNNYLGVEIRSNSNLSVQGSKLRGNSAGPWKVENGSRLVQAGNSE